MMFWLGIVIFTVGLALVSVGYWLGVMFGPFEKDDDICDEDDRQFTLEKRLEMDEVARRRASADSWNSIKNNQFR